MVFSCLLTNMSSAACYREHAWSEIKLLVHVHRSIQPIDMTPQSPYTIHQLSTGINLYFVNLFTPDLHLTDSKVSMIYSWLFRIWICLELPSRSFSGIVCTQSTGWQYVAEILCLFQGELWILFTEPVSPPRNPQRSPIIFVHSLESPCSFFFWPSPEKPTQTEHNRTSGHQLHQCKKRRLSDSLSHLAMVACRAC